MKNNETALSWKITPVNRTRLADLGLLSVAFTWWGCTFLIVQHVVRVFPPLAFNGIRFIGAALLLALIISVFYRREGKLLSSLCILGGMLLAELKSAG